MQESRPVAPQDIVSMNSCAASNGLFHNPHVTVKLYANCVETFGLARIISVKPSSHPGFLIVSFDNPLVGIKETELPTSFLFGFRFV